MKFVTMVLLKYKPKIKKDRRLNLDSALEFYYNCILFQNQELFSRFYILYWSSRYASLDSTIFKLNPDSALEIYCI
ncbi:hypothetical protein MCETHM1_00161 [Flavobacteriaceae bacterium]